MTTRDSREPFKAPEIVGGIKGGVGSGVIRETKSQTGTSWQAIALVGFLVLVILGQLRRFPQQQRCSSSGLC
ncbi:MAG: hypothetical protein ACRDRU_07635 [Pseudonocardiaceae bacterium]